MKRLSEEFEMEIPKGANGKVVEAAQKFAARFGKESLAKVAKLHFKTTSQI
jgi:ribonuclease HIII